MMLLEDRAHGLVADLGDQPARDGHVAQGLERPVGEGLAGQVGRRQRKFDQLAFVLGQDFFRRASVFVTRLKRGEPLAVEAMDDFAHVVGAEIQVSGDARRRQALRRTQNDFGAAHGDRVPAPTHHLDQLAPFQRTQKTDSNGFHNGILRIHPSDAACNTSNINVLLLYLKGH